MIDVEIMLESINVSSNDEFECRWLGTCEVLMAHLKLFGKFSDNYSGSKPAERVPNTLYDEAKAGSCTDDALEAFRQVQ
jgi:hypothetical protein